MTKYFLDVAYCADQSVRTGIPVLPHARYYVRGTEDDSSYIFLREDIFKRLESIPLYSAVETTESADAVLMPLDFSAVHRTAPHIENHYRNLAEKAGLPLLVAHFGDNTEDVPGENLIILRYSKYRSTLRANEILCPSTSADLCAEADFPILEKPKRPSVGFVGMSQKSDTLGRLRRMFSYGKRDYMLSGLSLLSPSAGYRRSGLYFRSRVLNVLEKTEGVKCDFIQRNFWGREFTARREANKVRLRQDFLDNVARNIYLLCIRGAGNYSIRFFEILSAGRIPVIIDTDAPLPMEDIINYRSFCLFVDAKDLKQTGRHIIEHHASFDSDALIDMQLKAQRTFREKLRFDVFSERLFRETLPAMLRK